MQSACPTIFTTVPTICHTAYNRRSNSGCPLSRLLSFAFIIFCIFIDLKDLCVMSFILKKSYHVLQIANGTVSHTARPSGRIQRNTAANPAPTVTDTISTDIPSTSAVAVANAAKTRPSGETSCLALVAEAATMSTAFDLRVAASVRWSNGRRAADCSARFGDHCCACAARHGITAARAQESQSC